ncbi:hypothetical protein EVAR_57307_1 [Eumeta japonica]|uniref:Uncharacterized protein n=1 Tax=Eumeta variegata TaxID=151549 RepID=A0A4C1ZI49_EUMVA|nr:hypothetical protein EVAR_57307_1 [Eumeta japonica]
MIISHPDNSLYVLECNMGLKFRINCGKAIPWSIWLRHKNKSARPARRLGVKYHTLTEYEREVAAFAAALHLVRQSSGSPLLLPSTSTRFPLTTYPIPS